MCICYLGCVGCLSVRFVQLLADSNVQEAACTRTGRVCILNDFTSSLVDQRQGNVHIAHAGQCCN